MEKQKKVSIGRLIWGTILGLLIFNFLAFIIWVSFMAFSAAQMSKKETASVKPKSVLKLTLNKPIVEHSIYEFKFNLFSPENSTVIGLDDLIEAIKNAKENPNISGIFLDLRLIQADLSTLYEIRKALQDFKQSGKFIIAHSDTYLQLSYYLASVADKVYLTPTGNLIWKGFAAQLMYYKSALQKLDIEPIIVRHGKYKSAVEPFMQDTISEENRLQLAEVLNDYWNLFIQEIAQARELSPDDLKLYADSLLITSDKKALDFKLVDNLKYRTEVIDEIKEMLDLKKNKKVNFVSYKSLLKEPKVNKNKIAVIFAEGGIVDGKNFKNLKIVSNYYAKLIRKLSADSSVKAIVLRVNSPGGSALASQIILNELIEAKKNKPVVVSMGRYAASGGYYISSNADFIYAEPYTLTGSIGVLGIFFNLEKTMKNKLGITVNTVETSPYALGLSPFKRPKPREIEYLKIQIEDIYRIFVHNVAMGRDLDTNYVDSIGQGRIWSATKAKQIGLVDELGTLNDAITKAANLAGISNKTYTIVKYPKKKTFFETLKEQLDDQVSILTYNIFGFDYYKELKKQLSEYQGIQARMLLDFEIE